MGEEIKTIQENTSIIDVMDKYKEFIEPNKSIFIVLFVMIIGFFIGKMWTIKYGILSFFVAFIVVGSQIKIPKKKKVKK